MEWRKIGGVETLCFLLGVATFAADVFVPRGVAMGIPYVVIVLLTLWTRKEGSVWAAAAGATVLMMLGFVLSPPGETPLAGLSNRALTGFAIWVIAALVARHRRNERAVRTSEATARAVLDAFADPVVICDGEGRIRSSNPAFRHAVADDPPGCNVADILPGLTPDFLARVAAAPAAGPLLSGRELEYQSTDGATRLFDASVSEVGGSPGALYVIVLRDVTERRRVEREVQQQSEQERRRVGYGLHEELGQMLTGATLMARRLARDLQANTHPGAEDASQIADLLKQTDRFAKDLFRALVPVELDPEGFADAVRLLLRRTGESAGVACTFEVGDSVVVRDPFAAACLYQILHEAVGEAVARTPECIAVSLRQNGPGVVASVRAVGCADAASANTRRAVMQYWARLIGARLDEGPDSIVVALGEEPPGSS